MKEFEDSVEKKEKLKSRFSDMSRSDEDTVVESFEIEELVSSDGEKKHTTHKKLHSTNRKQKVTATLLLIVSVMIYLRIARGHHSQKQELEDIRTSIMANMSLYKCPAFVDVSKNDKEDGSIADFYNGTNSKNHAMGISHFHEWVMDGYSLSYEEMKERMYTWKKEEFGVLNSGDRIYESGCGNGLNLAMTVEILNETKGIQGLIVYGNDYVEDSIKFAESLFDDIPPAGAIKGIFCRADSTNLDTIPSDSFDLAYTGLFSYAHDEIYLYFFSLFLSCMVHVLTDVFISLG